MSGTKFTKGPWIAISRGSYGPDGEEADVHIQEWWDVNGPLDDTNFMRGSYSMADAHLIAAAPDLYEALEWLETYAMVQVDRHPDAQDNKGWRNIIAALAKARGETPA